jgi:hypothetical protein
MARLERLKELEEFEMEQKQAEYEQDKKNKERLTWLKNVELKQIKAENTLKGF